MPRFFFNIHNDIHAEDHEGQTLADLGAAIAHAVAGARGLAAEAVLEGHFDSQHHIEILDGERRPVAKVSFGDAVEIR